MSMKRTLTFAVSFQILNTSIDLFTCILAYLYMLIFISLFISSRIFQLWLLMYFEHHLIHLLLYADFGSKWLFYLIKYHLESSKQRTRLRSKISTEKAKLTSRIQQYNEQTQGDQVANLQSACTVSEVMKGNFPWRGNAGELWKMSNTH